MEILYNNAKKQLYEFISSFKEKYHINQYPVDTIKICVNDDTITLVMHEFNTYGFCGAALAGEKNDTIILNTSRSAEQLNFDCGHEIIHLIKHKSMGKETFTCFDKKQNSFIEWEANEGAAEFILSYKTLLPILKENWNYLNSNSKICEFKEFLCHKFMLPPAVIELRIANLKYETHQYINGVPLSNIEILSNKQQSLRGIRVMSLNDIHRQYQAQDDFSI